MFCYSSTYFVLILAIENEFTEKSWIEEEALEQWNGSVHVVFIINNLIVVVAIRLSYNAVIEIQNWLVWRILQEK